METNYEFNFRITCNNKSKYITVKGTSEYASSYVAGYVQAMKDKGLTDVEVDKISATYITGSFPTKESTKEVH
tara:strand:- start:48 stop:266 length:219 start_codon:yes stop_codon:yes gene_type:complete